jgi:Rad3-related DNA helicase
MYKWKWWYDYETTKTIVQSVGRSVRNEADFAVTYILDEDWHRFASKNVNMLPENLAATIK